MVLEYLKAQKNTSIKEPSCLLIWPFRNRRCSSESMEDSGSMHFFISNPFQEDFEAKWKDMG